MVIFPHYREVSLHDIYINVLEILRSTKDDVIGVEISRMGVVRYFIAVVTMEMGAMGFLASVANCEARFEFNVVGVIINSVDTVLILGVTNVDIGVVIGEPRSRSMLPKRTPSGLFEHVTSMEAASAPTRLRMVTRVRRVAGVPVTSDIERSCGRGLTHAARTD